MIDIVARQNLTDMLIRCFQKKADWDDLDEFMTNNHSLDTATWEIGRQFWTIWDPEWPENLANLTQGLVFRVLLFLHTNYEYIPPPKSRNYLFSFIYGIFSGFMVLLGIRKIRPPSPEEEEKLFWPFASQSTYLHVKSIHEACIRGIVQGIEFDESHAPCGKTAGFVKNPEK